MYFCLSKTGKDSVLMGLLVLGPMPKKNGLSALQSKRVYVVSILNEHIYSQVSQSIICDVQQVILKKENCCCLERINCFTCVQKSQPTHPPNPSKFVICDDSTDPSPFLYINFSQLTHMKGKIITDLKFDKCISHENRDCEFDGQHYKFISRDHCHYKLYGNITNTFSKSNATMNYMENITIHFPWKLPL
ncbi:hypothetical protein CHS0354_028400 [Potamilus streckersoni]|uniref:Uncharacterized protein n=1 Tax=Potamilus streckersoni TaxID=2493646 RepID=A0AAE0RU96_9BIVA|nr:hypothetical protein CHS0354_028400 [Potamilus streckersoni]